MQTKKKSILIIEDDPDILECCKMAIESLEFFDFIVTASNTSEAITKLNNQKFNFCLTDLNLGSKTILEVFNVLLKHFEANQITVLSGYLDKESVETFIEHKVKNILTKPIETNKLVDHYKRQISKIKDE